MTHNVTHRLAAIFTATALVAAVLAVSAVQIHAQDVAPNRNRFFGAAGMAVGQTARVNIAQISDPGEFPSGAACGIIINFFGADGSPLTAPSKMAVQPGQIVFTDLVRNSLTSIRGNRVPFRVAVNLIGDPNAVPDPCADIRATVEVYDNLTGRTMVFIGDPGI